LQRNQFLFALVDILYNRTEVEFKTAQFELNRDTFDSVCAFLNRNGGNLILGVTNEGKIEGITEDCIQSILNNLVTSANNPQKLSPTFYFSPKVYEDENNKKIIHVFIPESSQVHQTNGKIFDRNQDGDFDVTNNQKHIAQLFLRKNNSFTENEIYPFLTINDFDKDLFQRVKQLASNQRPDHVWLELSNEELLKSIGLYRKDFKAGSEGYTLASVLLFGKNEVIQSILPQYKTDAILRVVNLDRYDDRDDIRTNLIDSYDRLMAFARKHLPDNFYQENDHRISLRDRIFREVVANMLIHREYKNAFPATFTIEAERAVTVNWNRPHGMGNIDPSIFCPFPKNPIIANFFKEIGRADELGSGIRNTYKYCKLYVGRDENPQFIEGDVFRTLVPTPRKLTLNVEGAIIDLKTGEVKSTVKKNLEGATEGATEGVIEGVIEGVTEGVKKKLVMLLVTIIENEGKRIPFYAKVTGIPEKTVEGYIKRLRDAQLIEFSKDEAPKVGGYYITNELKKKINK